MASAVTKAKTLEGGEENKAQVHKIRITLTSQDVTALEKVCSDLKGQAESTGLKGKVSGPVRLPTKTLRITTRKTPCGEGSKTWDRFEMRVHKRIIDLHAPADTVKRITAITLEAGVHVEVTVK